MNTKLTLQSIIVFGTLLASASVLAEGGLLGGWNGNASLGAVATSGNSDTKNINGSVNMNKDSTTWKQTVFGSIYSSESNEVETADRFDLGYKLNRKINESLYAFARIRYDADEYGNIDKRISGVVGVGKTLIDSQKQKLSGELGFGSAKTKYLTLTPVLTSAGVVDPAQTPLESIDDNGRMIYGALNYRRVLNKNLTFNSDLIVESAESNTNVIWDNSLGVKMTERLSLSLGLLSRSNTDIVGQRGEKTDTATRLSINYGF